MAFDPTSFKVLSFDIYGTLIDWETGIYTSLLPLISKLAISSIHHPSNSTETQNRSFILGEYTKLELAIQKENPPLAYPEVLASIYSRLAAQLNIPHAEHEATKFGESVGSWPAFPDTVAAMQSLSTRYKLIVLSNVDRASFSRTLSGPLAGVSFDAIYTAEDIGSYKPDLRNFEYLVMQAGKDFGARKEEILKVAQSLIHDHIPAKKFGLRPSVWIKRAGDGVAMGGKWAEYGDQVELGATFGTLGEFAKAVEEAFAREGV